MLTGIWSRSIRSTWKKTSFGVEDVNSNLYQSPPVRSAAVERDSSQPRRHARLAPQRVHPFQERQENVLHHIVHLRFAPPEQPVRQPADVRLVQPHQLLKACGLPSGSGSALPAGGGGAGGQILFVRPRQSSASARRCRRRSHRFPC